MAAIVGAARERAVSPDRMALADGDLGTYQEKTDQAQILVAEAVSILEAG